MVSVFARSLCICELRLIDFVAIAIAAITIFIRCVYRVVELAGGFDGRIANMQVPFMILEGPMIMIAVLLMTIFHQGIVFRGGYWQASNWKLRPGKASGKEEIDSSSSSEIYNRKNADVELSSRGS